ncbi:Protein priB [Lentinula edodes]|uniref:Protein priB n=1 Tax=Lentinula edodes TaxID=5353 RepID=A0A1Q3E2V2_LENED|nr:Protein priB [Lentinula edodes]
MEELGFAPGDRNIVIPAAIPLWLQEQSLNDLGLPVNGSDGIFLQMAGNGWAGDFAPMPEACFVLPGAFEIPSY